MEEADRGGKLGMGPVTGVDLEDLQGGGHSYRTALMEVMANLLPHVGSDFIREKENPRISDVSNETKVKDKAVKPATSLIIPVVDPNDTLI